MTYFEGENTHCPVELSLQIINRKWVLQIICEMFFGKSKFSEFQERNPELSNKALSRSLKYMEEQNLIEKVVDEEDKKNINYYLTEKGKSLNYVLYDLVIFTLNNEDNAKYYTEETKEKTEQMFRERLGIKKQ